MTLDQLTAQAMSALAPLLLAALSYATVRATQWLQAKTESAYLDGVIGRLNDAVLESIADLEATTVKQIKAAAEDGKITADEAETIKADAVAKVHSYLGAKGLDRAKKILGADALEAMVETKIEAFLEELKGKA